MGPTPRDSNSGCLGPGLRICLSDKFPSDVEASSLRFSLDHVFRLECSIEFVAKGKWEADNPRHAMELQLIELSPLDDCDGVSCGPKWLLHLTIMSIQGQCYELDSSECTDLLKKE